MTRPGLRAAAACALALPVLLAGSTASAATSRWSEPTVSPTMNDGIEVSGLTLMGQTVLHNASIPFFMLNGARYEFTESARVAGPFEGEAEGFRQYSAVYAVPVKGGTVRATLYYTLIDQAGEDTDEAQLSAWVKFDGPKGDYRFYWRMDADLGSRDANRVERGTGGDLKPLTLEGRVDLNRESVRVIDARSYEEEAQLYFSPRREDNASLHAVRFNAGEFEQSPTALSNGEALTGNPKGSDLVLWYETHLEGVTGGLTGPDVYAIAATRVNAIMEEDKMSSAEFINESAYVYGTTRSMKAGFATGGINITNIYNDKSNLADDSASTNAELHSLMVSNKTYEGQDSSTQWYSWTGQVLKSSSGSGVLGIMFDDGNTNTDGKPRQGCAVFYQPHKDGSWPSGDTYQAEMILSLTHEQGHVYNQHHEDYCSAKGASSTFKKYSAIMGYAFNDTGKWTFSPGSINTMQNEAAEYVRPGMGKAFTSGGSYNMTSAHSAKHSSTSCRRRCCGNQ